VTLRDWRPGAVLVGVAAFWWLPWFASKKEGENGRKGKVFFVPFLVLARGEGGKGKRREGGRTQEERRESCASQTRLPVPASYLAFHPLSLTGGRGKRGEKKKNQRENT